MSSKVGNKITVKNNKIKKSEPDVKTQSQYPQDGE
jgi:hypothetical protein